MNTTSQTMNSNIWKNSNFRNFFLTSAFFNLAFHIYGLSIPLIMYELTQSSKLMGVVRGVEFLPNVLFAIVIGVFFDRVNRKKWSVRFLGLQAILVLALFFLIHFKFFNLIIISLFTFLIMLLGYTFFNASFGIQKVVLPVEDQGKSIAALSSLSTFFEIIGPALSGLFIFTSSLNYILIIVSLFFILAQFFLKKISYAHPYQTSQQNIFNSLKEVWLIFLSQGHLKTITVIAALCNASVAVYEIQSLYIAKEILKMNAFEVGVMVACLGVGGFIGSFVVNKFRSTLGMGRVLVFSALISGAVQIFPLVSTHQFIFMVSHFLLGFFVMFTNVCIWSYRQEVTPAHLMGRMVGMTGSLFKVLMPPSLFASGYVLQAYGMRTLFACSSLLIVIPCLFFLIFNRGLLKIR